MRIALRAIRTGSSSGGTIFCEILEVLDLLEKEGQIFLKTTQVLCVLEKAPVWRVEALRVVLVGPAAVHFGTI